MTSNQLRFVEFTLDQYPGILDLEFPEEKPGKSETYTNVSLSSLQDEDEVNVLGYLLYLLEGGQGNNTTEDNLLLVKSKGGIPQDVYGATVYREGEGTDRLIVKFGENIFPCNFDEKGGKLEVGSLVGKFKFLDKKKVDDTPYQKLVSYFSPPEDPYTIYVFGVQLQKNLSLTEPAFDAAIASGKGVAQFLQVPSSRMSFGEVLNVGDLEVGCYPIEAIARAAIKEPKKNKFCYFIQLSGGLTVFANGQAYTQLTPLSMETGNDNRNWTKRIIDQDDCKVSKPCHLKVANKRQYKNKNGEMANTADSQIILGIPKEISGSPTKIISQASAALPAANDVSFASKGEAIAWAKEQGVTSASAEKCYLSLDMKKSKDERQQQFMDLVGKALKATIEPTTVEVDIDEIPY